jgi:hypothetical protein
LRGARACLFAGTSAALTYSAHLAGAGELPDTGSALLLVGLTAFVGTVFADRHRGSVAVIGTLGAVQVALHVMLTWLSGLGHHHGVLPSGTMVVCHAVAAVGIGLVLAHADAALMAALQVLVSLLPSRPNAWPARCPLWVATVRPTTVASTVVPLRVCARRGPPPLQF